MINGRPVGLTVWVIGTCVTYRLIMSPLVACASRSLYEKPRTVMVNGAFPSRPIRFRALATVICLFGLIAAVGLVVGTGTSAEPATMLRIAIVVTGWKQLTRDYDVAFEIGWQRRDRLLGLILAGLAIAFVEFSVLYVVFLCARLGGWTHHSKACVRILKVYGSWLFSSVILNLLPFSARFETEQSALLIVMEVCFLSHYVVAAVAKCTLGNRPWDWLGNPTQNLIATGYQWGWRHSRSEESVMRSTAKVARIRVPLNCLTLLVEVGGVLALQSSQTLVFLLLCAAAFNLVVLYTSGLFFLENMLMAVAFCVFPLVGASDEPRSQFGFVPLVLSIAMEIAVVGGFLWKPARLGWWDSPLTCRVRWEAVLKNGDRRGIYNRFMDPNDREYGRDVGKILVDRPILTYSMGGVENQELLRILSSPNLLVEKLEELRAHFGTRYFDPRAEGEHVLYMQHLFGRLLGGAGRDVLPAWLRWIRAPGGHLYGSGSLKAYSLADGAPVRLLVRYEEMLFDARLGGWISTDVVDLFEIPIVPVASPLKL